MQKLLARIAPQAIIVFTLTAFMIIGAVVFRKIDPVLAEQSFYEVIFFEFITISTIGYGNQYPQTTKSRIFSIFFSIIGIPLLVVTLGNFGKYLTKFYWKAKGCLSSQKTDSELVNDKDMPGFVIALLYFLTFAIGFLFIPHSGEAYSIDDCYFSFISFAAVGFGDKVPEIDTFERFSKVTTYLLWGTILNIILISYMNSWFNTATSQMNSRKNFRSSLASHIVDVIDSSFIIVPFSPHPVHLFTCNLFSFFKNCISDSPKFHWFPIFFFFPKLQIHADPKHVPKWDCSVEISCSGIHVNPGQIQTIYHHLTSSSFASEFNSISRVQLIISHPTMTSQETRGTWSSREPSSQPMQSVGSMYTRHSAMSTSRHPGTQPKTSYMPPRSTPHPSSSLRKRPDGVVEDLEWSEFLFFQFRLNVTSSKTSVKHSNEKFAVKAIDVLELTSDVKNKFLPREISCWRKLKNPYLVSLHAQYEAQNMIFLTMEYGSQGDLLRYVQDNGGIDERRAGQFMSQLMRGLQYMHSKQIAHRDIKLENIILFDNCVKLSDFGFVRQVDNQTLSLTFCGSKSYSAPELLRGIGYNPFLSDVWSLGVVGFVMVTNRMPFDEKKPNNVIVELQRNRQYVIPDSKNSKNKTRNPECKSRRIRNRESRQKYISLIPK
ncbi:Protein CBR-TWK-5 [Caenorhabditis briggsae]|uniref:Protein CBR-TWK-5 n=1 Tax=Caenorhabditis briggsae TaxID=6238 RepID=A8WTB0_CAEBR|nr:Protein CBR-TWK-5 [Caenorhabditis briggsae]CAP23721.2 Protein CBR-TWK-5 [Caenorhabditis briggsae]